MFEALEQPRFIVTGRVVQGRQCFLTWDFLFAFQNFHKGVTQTVAVPRTWCSTGRAWSHCTATLGRR